MTRQILPGVPASVPRYKLARMVESLGLDLKEVRGLEFHPEAIYAEVFARDPIDEAGNHYAVGDEVATHRICIRVTDDPHPLEKASDA